MSLGDGGARRLTRADMLALSGLVLFCLGLLWQLLLAGRILAGPDAFSYFYPLYDYASRRLLSGELPLWNPYLFMGAPFLANSQAGVFYPLHWPLLGLAAPYMASATLALHTALMAAFTYLLLRLERDRSVLAAVVGSVALVAGGLVGSQAEHFNQVETLAWLPLQVLLLHRAMRAGAPPGGRPVLPWAALAAAALVACLQLLAGHTQAAFICQTALLACAVLCALEEGRTWRARARLAAVGGAFVVLAAALGALMAAIQLIPTFELSRLSIRAGGLTYRQAAAFSFGPRTWLMGLLPHFGAEEPFGEYATWVGLAALLLAAIGALRRWRHGRVALGLAAVGLFLALGGYNPVYYLLYRVVPGFDLFRVPARWLALYALGMAMLVADGLDALGVERPRPRLSRRGGVILALTVAVGAAALALSQPRPEAMTVVLWGAFGAAAVALALCRRSSIRRGGLALLVVVELVAAGRALPYNQGTAAHTYFATRRSLQAMAAAGLYRFLAVSEGEFDSGDMPDLSASLGSTLSAAGRYQLLVTSKMQELLARNLALHWGTYAVDGYDGGVLPTQDFVNFERLFVGDEASSDGRLSQVLKGVPRQALLALTNVRYVITDRVGDLWLDGIYYDLGQPLSLAAGEEAAATDVPRFPADALGLVLSGAAGEGEVLRVDLGGGVRYAITASASSLSATRSDGVTVVGSAVAGRDGVYYVRLLLPVTTYAGSVGLTAGTAGPVTIEGMSLVNEAVGTGVAVPLGGGLVPVHYGDVKVYEFADTLPRAYFADCVTHVASADDALESLSAPNFDPRLRTIIAADGEDACPAGAAVQPAAVVGYAPESVTVMVNAPAAGYLVLLDSYFPGWSATVDGEAVAIVRANYTFRAVPVVAGRHTVTFSYRPKSLLLGTAGSAAGWATWLALGLGAILRRRQA
ncbi:MAG: YfhO family protein, partial [Anaerolineae bacterium]